MKLRTPSMPVLLAVLLLLMPAFSQATATAQATTRGCTSGSSGIGDSYYPFMGNSGYDARHYTLDLDLDVQHGTIRSGTATMQALAGTDLCRFNLDFNGLMIDAVRVDGVPAQWSRNGQELTIQPAAPLAAGAAFVVETDYHGKPFTLETTDAAQVKAVFDALATPGALESPPMATPVADGEDGAGPDPIAELESFSLGLGMDVERYGPTMGGWWTTPGQIFVAGEPRGAETWYPVNGHPADKATYTLRLTVDDGYDVVANGERVGRDEADGKRTVTWVSREPMASYLVTFYAGDIDIDFADAPAGGGPAFRYAYGKAVPEWQRTQLETVTPEMIEFFADRFGEYPFAVAGGMIVDGTIWFALETQTIPIFGIQVEAPDIGITREMIEPMVEETIAHELAHQWFGDSVSPLRWQDVYLNEGLSQYGMYLWIEQRNGRAALESRLRLIHGRLAISSRLNDPEVLAQATGKDMLEALGELSDVLLPDIEASLGVDSREAVEGLPAEAVLAALEDLSLDRESVLGPPPVLTGDPGAENGFSGNWVYERGALATHALRLELGDEVFFDLLRAWSERQRSGSATVQDFIALAEQVSAKDLGAFFDSWLFQLPMPPYPGGDATTAATPAP